MFCNTISNDLIKLGSTGSDVIQLQKALRLLGYSFEVQVTGVYDRGTKKAIEDYQRSHNLSVDGVVGPETGGSLCALGYLQKIFQEPTTHIYPPVKSKTPGNVRLPSDIFSGLKNRLQGIPSWIWIGVIGISFIVVGENK